MCPPRFSFDPIGALVDLDTDALSILGAGVISLAGLGLVLAALQRRRRALRSTWETLDEGTLAVEAPPPIMRLRVIAAACAFVVPAVAAVIAVRDRAELREAIVRAVEGTRPPQHLWGPAAVSIDADLAWAAVVWMAVVPVATVALALATSLSWQTNYIRTLLALSRGPSGRLSPTARYRRAAHGHDEAALRRRSIRRPPPLSAALAIWASVGLSAMAFASGVVRALLTTLDPINHVPQGESWRLEEGLANGAAVLGEHAIASAAIMLIAATIAVATRRWSLEGLRPPSWRGIVARLTIALACLILASPLMDENAHPLPIGAMRQAGTEAVVATLPLTPPDLVGEEQLPYGPELRLGATVTMDGMVVQSADELEELTRRKRELWESFHPSRRFPGLLRVAADRRVSTERFRRWLSAARRGGFDTAILVLSRPVPFDHPPLGLWHEWHELSGVRVSLGCTDGAARIDIEAPHVEALARRALEARRGATPCLPSDSGG